jgi:hypothetical protein
MRLVTVVYILLNERAGNGVVADSYIFLSSALLGTIGRHTVANIKFYRLSSLRGPKNMSRSAIRRVKESDT